MPAHRCINGSQAGVAAPAGAEQARAVITDPPLLGWHETTHAAFPQPFRQQAASLLLCWQRLASGSQVCDGDGSENAAPSASGGSSSGGSSSSEAASNLGCLPFELVGADYSACQALCQSGSCVVILLTCRLQMTAVYTLQPRCLSNFSFSCRPASLPPPQVRHIIVQLAPSGLWQEGRAAAHPDIPPVQLHSRSGFRQLVRSTHKATGQALPPRSRLSVLEVTPRQAPPPPQAEQWPRSPLAALNRLMNGLFGPGAAAE